VTDAAAALPEATRAALVRGAALYDAGLFWESHEAWEEAWLVEEGLARVLLQGLIQVAAGFHKAFVQRQPRGCVKLLGSGLDKLRSVPGDLGGVPLSRFVPQVEAQLAEALRWKAGALPGLDRAQVPRLELGPID
jgi:predicted metal-dependent hydrolase